MLPTYECFKYMSINRNTKEVHCIPLDYISISCFYLSILGNVYKIRFLLVLFIFPSPNLSKSFLFPFFPSPHPFSACLLMITNNFIWTISKKLSSLPKLMKFVTYVIIIKTEGLIISSMHYARAITAIPCMIMSFI